MNRTVKEAAQVLGIRESELRAFLRHSGALNNDGTLAARHVGGGNLFMGPRVAQPRNLGGRRRHYAVLKVTEQGIDWLAKKLGIHITEMPQQGTAA